MLLNLDSPVVKLTVRRVHALGKMYDLHLDYSAVFQFQSHSPKQLTSQRTDTA